MVNLHLTPWLTIFGFLKISSVVEPSPGTSFAVTVAVCPSDSISTSRKSTSQLHQVFGTSETSGFPFTFTTILSPTFSFAFVGSISKFPGVSTTLTRQFAVKLLEPLVYLAVIIISSWVIRLEVIFPL